jgi:hypothetical protein
VCRLWLRVGQRRGVVAVLEVGARTVDPDCVAAGAFLAGVCARPVDKPWAITSSDHGETSRGTRFRLLRATEGELVAYA